MSSIEFLQNKLQFIADLFPNVHIKYGYNQIIETHIVELLPLKEYRYNQELDRVWIPISLEFNEKFSGEDIAFISSDSSLALADVLLEFNSNACSEENVITEIFAPLTEPINSYSFQKYFFIGKILRANIDSYINSPIEKLSEESYSENSYSVAA